MMLYSQPKLAKSVSYKTGNHNVVDILQSPENILFSVKYGALSWPYYRHQTSLTSKLA